MLAYPPAYLAHRTPGVTFASPLTNRRLNDCAGQQVNIPLTPAIQVSKAAEVMVPSRPSARTGRASERARLSGVDGGRGNGVGEERGREGWWCGETGTGEGRSGARGVRGVMWSGTGWEVVVEGWRGTKWCGVNEARLNEGDWDMEWKGVGHGKDRLGRKKWTSGGAGHKRIRLNGKARTEGGDKSYGFGVE